jgi:predicted dehydrogenase
MMAGAIRVGLVGANAERGWAQRAHAPALAANPGFTLTAVCNRHRDEAERAKDAFGATVAFMSAEELASCDGVDLVVVAVKVPEHAAAVHAALAARKHVYCEWPLARDANEAHTLAAAAEVAGVVHVVGLQARAAQAVRLVRDAVQAGEIGDVLSASVIGSARGWGATTDEHRTYTEDARSGASMLSIAFGHAVDAFCWVLGDFDQVSATLAIRRSEIAVEGTERTVTRTVHDQVAVTGTLEDGAVASIHYRGGRSAGTNFLWEINGTRGDIVVTAATGQLQMSAPRVSIARGRSHALEEISLEPAPPVPEEAANVAAAYELLARRIAGEERTGLASFADAAGRHELLARIEDAARTGRLQPLEST